MNIYQNRINLSSICSTNPRKIGHRLFTEIKLCSTGFDIGWVTMWEYPLLCENIIDLVHIVKNARPGNEFATSS